MPLIDPNKNPVGLDKRLEGETDPKRRRMLEEVRFHIAVEAGAEIEPALARLAPNAEYHLFDHANPNVVTLSGVDAIRRDFYDQLVAAIDPRLEWDIIRCMVDGDAVITEGRMKVAMRGTTLNAMGIDADPQGFYLQQAQHLVVWPFDSQTRLIGETVYYGNSTPFSEVAKRRLKPEDIGTYSGPVIPPQ